MGKIGIEKGIIKYYGNPAGYLKGSKAVVDFMFQSEEMTEFLSIQRDIKEIKWERGVFDRLANGQKELGEIAMLKNCRIWQLKPESDIKMRFISYDELTRNFDKPNLENYQTVYDGKVESNELESIYVKFNHHRPDGYTGHSLSMSDLVELYDNDGNSFHYCDRFGFKEIDFDPPTQIQTMQL